MPGRSKGRVKPPPTDVDGLLRKHAEMLKQLKSQPPARRFNRSGWELFGYQDDEPEVVSEVTRPPRPPVMPGHIPNEMSARARRAKRAAAAAALKKPRKPRGR